MGAIRVYRKAGGKTSDAAQVRRKKSGKTPFSASETFDREIEAKRWIRRREQELARPGGFEDAALRHRVRSHGEVIETCIIAHGKPIGRSKMQNLRAIQWMEIAQETAEALAAADLSQSAMNLLIGVQPSPIDPETAPLTQFGLKPRKPQTVGGDLSHLGVMLRHTALIVRMDLPPSPNSKRRWSPRGT